jgi:hypothetical protein
MANPHAPPNSKQPQSQSIKPLIQHRPPQRRVEPPGAENQWGGDGVAEPEDQRREDEGGEEGCGGGEEVEEGGYVWSTRVSSVGWGVLVGFLGAVGGVLGSVGVGRGGCTGVVECADDGLGGFEGGVADVDIHCGLL